MYLHWRVGEACTCSKRRFPNLAKPNMHKERALVALKDFGSPIYARYRGRQAPLMMIGPFRRSHFPKRNLICDQSADSTLESLLVSHNFFLQGLGMLSMKSLHENSISISHIHSHIQIEPRKSHFHVVMQRAVLLFTSQTWMPPVAPQTPNPQPHLPPRTPGTPRRRKFPSSTRLQGVKPQLKPLSDIKAKVVEKLKLSFTPEDWQIQFISRIQQRYDSIFCAGTGYGKSLIFEGLAVLGGKRKSVMVISHLKALERDQVSIADISFKYNHFSS